MPTPCRLPKSTSIAISSCLPCLAAQCRHVNPVTKSFLERSVGSRSSSRCRLSHSPSAVHIIHSCSSGSNVTEPQSSSTDDVLKSLLLADMCPCELRCTSERLTCTCITYDMHYIHLDYILYALCAHALYIIALCTIYYMHYVILHYILYALCAHALYIICII